MNIIADLQIPRIERACEGIGKVQLCHGRDITPNMVADADALLVRSVTRVNKQLLQGSKVRYVATATSGVDHIDIPYLQERGIGFASAHGSNARSVAEYVLSALFVLADQSRFNLFRMKVGIIGCGKVGGMLFSLLQALGIQCLVNDPPLQEKTNNPGYCSLEEVLTADIITLHVPLAISGNHPTLNLINADILSALDAKAVLINTSRGNVLDEAALVDNLKKQNRPVVLDVWNNEPEINPETLAAVTIGTPHIAGYSIDAKMRATGMIHEGLCRFFSVKNDWCCDGEWKEMNRLSLKFDNNETDEDIIAMAVLSHYDVRSDAASLRRLLELDRGKRGFYFDELRKNYPVRREFTATSIQLPAGRQKVAEMLRNIGFTVAGPAE